LKLWFLPFVREGVALRLLVWRPEAS